LVWTLTKDDDSDGLF